MKSYTETTVLAAPSRAVYEYLASVENLPEWASEFARELKVVDGKYKVVNGLGEFFFEIRPNAESGVVDMYVGPDADSLAVFPARVVALGDEQSAFVFTMFQWPGQPDELFESQHDSLVRELANVRRRFGGD